MMKSDSQGFLIGERVPVTAQPDAMSGLAILRGMRTDVGVIRRLLEVGAAQRMRAPVAQVQAARGRRGISVTINGTASTVARSALLQSTRAMTATTSRAANMPARDARGRFVASRPQGVALTVPRGTVLTAVGQQTQPAPGAVPGSTPGAAPGVTHGVQPKPAPKTGKEATPEAPGARNSKGQFTGKGDGEKSSDYAGGPNPLEKIATTLEGVGNVLESTQNIDPTISALKEIQQVVSPVGRGIVSLGQRLAERRKERWYDRILKAVKGKKNEGVAGMGGSGGDVKSGSFFGTLMGEISGKLLGALGSVGGLLMKVFAPVAAAWAAWEVGQWIGRKVYDWLTETGLMDKIFEAFDTIKGYFKKAADTLKVGAQNAVDTAVQIDRDSQLGRDEARYGRLTPEDRREARLGSRGGPPDSMAYRAGAAVGAALRAKDTVAKAAGDAMQWAKNAYADSPLGQMIGAKESKNDYSAYNSTKSGKLKAFYNTGLADMSLGEVMAKQASGEILAAGRFQVIPSTMKMAAKSLKLDPSAKFDKAMQDKIFEYLITHKRPEIKKFLDGGGSLEDAQLGAAKEWAALPVAPGTRLNSGQIAKGGESFYAGDGLNKSGVSVEQTQQVFMASRAAGAPVATPNPASFLPAQPPAMPMSVPKNATAAQPANVPERLNTGAQTAQSIVLRGEVGQDVSDRTIAHVATGGMGKN